MSSVDPKVKGSIAVGRGNGFQVQPVGADTQVLTADSTQATGVKYAPLVVSGLLPLWLFGNGSDGNVTLVADTVLAFNDSLKYYDNLDLAGFALEQSASNAGMLIYVKSTLSLNGGEIRSSFQTFEGAAGSAGGATAGAGGGSNFTTEGRGRGYVFVFAREIVGTGTVHANGSTGTAGGNAAANPAGARGFGTDGGTSSANTFVSGGGTAASSLSLTANPGLTPGVLYTGGAGGTGPVGFDPTVLSYNWKDTAFVFTHVENSQSSAADLSGYGRGWGPGCGGGGGAGGNEAEGGAEKDGEAGGGGGGGGGYIGTGGDGGVGGDGNGHSATAGSGASGPGGGAGSGSGGFACVITNSAPSTLTVSANGAVGGIGGDGTDGGGGTPRRSGGGGGGGGGSGGLAVLLAQTGNGATVTAAGGAGGAGGAAGGAGATAGAAGTAGTTGLVVNLTFD